MKKKKKGKLVLLAKTKLKNIKFLISKGLIDSDISHDEFVSISILLWLKKLNRLIRFLFGWFLIRLLCTKYKNVFREGYTKKLFCAKN